MKLIELLLDNWVILVVIFFIISSLFKRRTAGGSHAQQKQQHSQPGQRRSSAPPGMPPFGGGGMGRPARTAAARPAAKSAPQPAVSPDKRLEPTPIHEVPASNRYVDAGISQRAAIAEARDNLQEEDSSPEKVRVQEAQSAPSGHLLQPEDALKGVLWAEILGPPRAKRPYGRNS